MSNKGVKCFISYSHKDSRMCERFRNHLDALVRLYEFENWYDGMIPAGGNIDKEVAKNLKDSDIVFLLISPDFIASDYCYSKELKMAIKRHREGKCIVVPIICKSYVPGTYPFSSLKFVPTDGRPINSFRPQDTGFINACTGIGNLLQEYFENHKLSYPKENQTKSSNSNNRSSSSRSQNIKFPIVKGKKISNDKLTQNIFDYLRKDSLLIQQFATKVDELTNRQLQSLSVLITPSTQEGAVLAYGKNDFESYLLQIFSYIQQTFLGTENTFAHFRFKKDDQYVSFVNVGYPIVNLPTIPISAKGGMIECSQSLGMPVIKSLNRTLHEKTHPNEHISRDYITCTFNKISKLYDIDISMCISIIGRTTKKFKEALVPLSILEIDKLIEKFLLNYISSCMQLNPKYNIKTILYTEVN